MYETTLFSTLLSANEANLLTSAVALIILDKFTRLQDNGLHVSREMLRKKVGRQASRNKLG